MLYFPQFSQAGSHRECLSCEKNQREARKTTSLALANKMGAALFFSSLQRVIYQFENFSSREAFIDDMFQNDIHISMLLF